MQVRRILFIDELSQPMQLGVALRELTTRLSELPLELLLPNALRASPFQSALQRKLLSLEAPRQLAERARDAFKRLVSTAEP